MARKPLPAAAAPADKFDMQAAQADSAALTVLGTRSAEVAEQYDEGMPYDRARLVSQARFFMGQSADAMLEAGKRLVVLKENEPHGEFQRIVTEQLGLEVRHAQIMMQAAVKFLSPALQANAKAISHLGRTKLLALALEPDDDLKALAEGGTVAGLDLDDMQAMSCRELRKALLEARKDAAAKDAVLEKKNKKIDALAEQLERRAANGDEAEAAQLDELRALTVQAEQALLQLLAAVDATTSAPATPAADKAARQSLDYITQRLSDAAQARGMALNLEDEVLPAHMAAIREAVAEGSKRKATN